MTARVGIDCNGRKYITSESRLLEKKREWVGLDEKKIYALYFAAQEIAETMIQRKVNPELLLPFTFYQAIEAALKEKNQ